VGTYVPGGGCVDGVEAVLPVQLHEYNDNDTFIIICSAREREIKERLINNNIYNFISYTQIDFGNGEEHYDEAYFQWQRSMGEFGAKLKRKLFDKYITPDMTVVEFGCGGGYLLNEINAAKKVGIEINEAAHVEIKRQGIDCVGDLNQLPDEFADIIISTSVLEHVENPLGELRGLYGKLKTGGKMVFSVPNESRETEYGRSDYNNHLYTWNCLNLGNLFKAAGFFVYSVERYQEIWPRRYREIRQDVSEAMFDELCEISGRVDNADRCIIVAIK
jgi:2-polyprenyl-3-methyl-5-hydroxy-6-metoxy-1,4-benzoquinol methylase